MSTIEDLMADVCVATDSGTHGMPDVLSIYERLDGTRYGVRTVCGVSTICGADAQSTHGHIRHLSHLTPGQRREQIAHLRMVEVEQAKAAERISARRAELARGWDGYRFIGVEKAREVLAAM